MTKVICIVCPKGCHLNVDEENGYVVTGFGCQRGIAYGQKELQSPTRVITSTVKLVDGIHPRCPVKTNGDIPKGMISQAMRLLDGIQLQSPVMTGEVVVAEIGNTGVSWVSTRSM